MWPWCAGYICFWVWQPELCSNIYSFLLLLLDGFLCMGVNPAYMSVPCAGLVPQSKKRVSDPLKLELQLIVSCYINVGNRIWVLEWKIQCSRLLSHIFNCTVLKAKISILYVLLKSQSICILFSVLLTHNDHFKFFNALYELAGLCVLCMFVL